MKSIFITGYCRNEVSFQKKVPKRINLNWDCAFCSTRTKDSSLRKQELALPKRCEIGYPAGKIRSPFRTAKTLPLALAYEIEVLVVIYQPCGYVCEDDIDILE